MSVVRACCASCFVVSVLFAAGCAEDRHAADSSRTTVHEPSAPVPAPASPSPAIASNQKVLDSRQSTRLISWARALRSCLNAEGLEAARPRASRKEIRISLRSSPAMQVLLAQVLHCAEPLGGPPKGSSVQTFETQVILYLPKQCLLDPKVTRQNS